MNDTVLWEVARAGGLVAVAMLGTSVASGLLMGMRWSSSGWPRSLLNEVHRFLTLLALVFTGVHVAGLLLDGGAGIGPVQVLVPLAAADQPWAVAAGVLSLELLVAVQVSTLLRSRIGYARWRRLHGLAFAVLALGVVHGLANGTDTGTGAATLVYLGVLALVGPLLIARVLGAGAPRRPAPRPAAPAPPAPRATTLPPLASRPPRPASLRPPGGSARAG